MKARSNLSATLLISILGILVVSLLGTWLPTIRAYSDYPPDYDEAVHLLPALQLADDIRSARVADFWLHTWNQDQIAAYPFVHSWLLAPLFAAWRPDVVLGRAAGLGILGVAAITVFLLARELARSLEHKQAGLSGLIGALLTLSCMTLWAYASLAYLEAAGLLVSMAALWCYVRAGPSQDRRGWLIAASLLAASALLTKYSFGVFVAVSIAVNEVVSALLARRWPSRQRLICLAGPFTLCAAIWFADPNKLYRFLVYSQSQKGQLAFWSAENLSYYPKNLLRYYASGPLSVTLILAGGLVGLRQWRQHGVRAVCVYLIVSLCALALVPQKAGRFLYTVAPAAFALAGPPVSVAIDWLARRERLRWIRAASLVLLAILCAFEARAVVWRFSLYDAAVEVNYTSSPDTRRAYQFVADNTLARGIRPHLLNGWHLFNGYALEWEYYIRAGGEPAAHDYQTVTMGLAPEPTEANLNALTRSLRERGIGALVSLDGSPAGQVTGWQVIEPLLARGQLDTHPDQPVYTLFEWRADYVDRVFAGAFANRAEFERVRSESRVEFPIQLHLYYLRP